MADSSGIAPKRMPFVEITNIVTLSTANLPSARSKDSGHSSLKGSAHLRATLGRRVPKTVHTGNAASATNRVRVDPANQGGCLCMANVGQRSPTATISLLPAPDYRPTNRLPASLSGQIINSPGEEQHGEPDADAMDVFIKDLRRESGFMVRPGFMNAQNGINERMRADIVDWLAHVATQFKLSRRTLFLAIINFDRFLQARRVERCELRLTACSAMFIAAKLEEVRDAHPPRVQDFVHVSDGTCTAADIKRMERTIMIALNFRFECPTVVEFLPHMIRVWHGPSSGSSGAIRLDSNKIAAWAACFGIRLVRSDLSRDALAWYFAELACLDVQMADYSPSRRSASGLLLSNYIHGCSTPWSQELEELTGYSESSLVGCVEALLNLHATHYRGRLTAIWRRYRAYQCPESIQTMV